MIPLSSKRPLPAALRLAPRSSRGATHRPARLGWFGASAPRSSPRVWGAVRVSFCSPLLGRVFLPPRAFYGRVRSAGWLVASSLLGGCLPPAEGIPPSVFHSLDAAACLLASPAGRGSPARRAIAQVTGAHIVAPNN